MSKIKTKVMVENCLRDYPHTRNSDIDLMIVIWKRYYGGKVRKLTNGDEVIRLSSLHELPREDHIKRIRAKFNSLGKYYPTDHKVAKARKINEDVWKETMGYNINRSEVNQQNII